MSIVSRSRALTALGGFAAAAGPAPRSRKPRRPTPSVRSYRDGIRRRDRSGAIARDAGRRRCGQRARRRRRLDLKAIPLDHKGTAAGGVQASTTRQPGESPVRLDGLCRRDPRDVSDGRAESGAGARRRRYSTNLLDKPWLYNDQLIGEPLNVPLAQYAREHGIRTAAILVGEDPLGRDNSAIFNTAFTKRGGTIIAGDLPDRRDRLLRPTRQDPDRQPRRDLQHRGGRHAGADRQTGARGLRGNLSSGNRIIPSRGMRPRGSSLPGWPRTGGAATATFASSTRRTRANSGSSRRGSAGRCTRACCCWPS